LRTKAVERRETLSRFFDFLKVRKIELILLLALLFRLFVLAWDSGVPPSPHPDERQVVSITQGMHHWMDDPGFFAYGTLHFHALRLMAPLMEDSSRWVGILAGGRLLSLLSSMLCLLLGYSLARSAWGKRAGLYFLLIGAFIPLDLQLSHFATVEAHHALWVMLCLTGLYQLASSDHWSRALISGGALGASLAVKISSLGLMVPVLLVFVILSFRVSFSRLLLLLQLLLLGAISAFWFGEAWAFAEGSFPFPVFGIALLSLLLLCFSTRFSSLSKGSAGLASLLIASELLMMASTFFPGVLRGLPHPGLAANPDFLRGVGAQIAMVSGLADLPYVRVYRHTLPLIYSIKNLFFWALGPGLIILFFFSAMRASGALWKRRKSVFRSGARRWYLLLILLAWIFPMAWRLSTLQVKFLRYWAPLLIPIALVGAWGLSRFRGRRRLVLMLSVCVSALWGIGYAWAFVEPHPFAQATSWLQKMVPADAAVAWEHWDEHLPGVGGEQLTLASYDLPDNPEKIRALGETLDRADWVILTSNRIRRTILTNPGLYPKSGRFYRLLFSGALGWDVISRAERSPRLWGLRAPVQIADESFVNYEFPRVVVLKRRKRLSVGEMMRLVEVPDSELDGLASAVLDRRYVDPVPEIPFRPGLRNQVLGTIIWLISAGLGAVALWAFLFPMFKNWPDGGLALALVSSWILPAWILWIMSEIFGLPVSPLSASLVFILLLGAGAGFCRIRRREFSALVLSRRKGIRRVLMVFLGVFLLFLLIRMINPAIYWGEKPMDFSFFNAFVNSSHWPPGEPWMAGEKLHYYYFGQVLTSFPALLTDLDTAVAYNLNCAIIPAFSAILLAAFGLLVARKSTRNYFAIIPFLFLLVGNLAWPGLIDLLRSGRYFDLWWATSRVIPGYAIDEYPLWTAVFADLHAHFIAQPLVIAVLLWAVVAIVSRGKPTAIAFLALTSGVLAATNPWDVPVLVFLIGTGLLTLGWTSGPGYSRFLISRNLLILLTAALLGVILILPFIGELAMWLRQGSAGQSLLFFNTRDFAKWEPIIRHFGLFLIPLSCLALARHRKIRFSAVLLIVAGVLGGLSFSSSAAALALALAFLFYAVPMRGIDLRMRIAWVLAGNAMIALAFSERFVLMDRMNTIFKIYNDIWLILALALGILLLRSGKKLRRLLLWSFIPLAFIAVLNLPLGFFQAWKQPRISSPRPNLDGRAFLRWHFSDDAFLVEALRGMAVPGDVVAEAVGPSYRNFTRISMQTGLSTILGWEWHLRQRGQDALKISVRRDAVKEIYNGSSGLQRREILDRYRVDWVVCGDLERKTYALRKADPLQGVPAVIPWVRRDRSILYRVLRPVKRKTD